MDKTLPQNPHIGSLIKEKLLAKGMTVKDFADAIHCTRQNAYRILQKENIDTDLLQRISRVLDCDLFFEISRINDISLD